ncbi:MAG TPA: tRNA uridine-5-carboxymethylaminomethyl(34) synthesis enzyme MnmG, partial [Candidatus Omnitrophota bacterium]|nr:tRNA uridine-5-carboxymethylaminomethyl(34) synthesis enzyme MnmG [Candidatus Omnitrophota bacterium]
NHLLKNMGLSEVHKQVTLEDLLKRPQINLKDLAVLDIVKEGTGLFNEDVAQQVEIEVKYAGFIQRQKDEVERFKKIERIKIPKGLEFRKIKGLSKEIVEKLEKLTPHSLGQAARISGVTPAAVSLLIVYLDKLKKEKGTDGKNKV